MKHTGNEGKKKPAPKTASKSTMSSTANVVKSVAKKLLVGVKK